MEILYGSTSTRKSDASRQASARHSSCRHILDNKQIGLALVCPITSRVKGYPFEVKVETKKISGVVLADHVKSVDWKGRHAALIESATEDTVAEVTAKLAALLPGTTGA